MAKINPAFMSFLPIHSRAYPDAQVLPLPQGPARNVPSITLAAMDFTVDSEYDLDLTSFLSATPPLHGIQGMYVNAANMTVGSCVITIQGNAFTQLLEIPPQSQGYYPLICQKTGPFLVKFANPSGLIHASLAVALDAHFLTIPVVAAAWKAQYPYTLPMSAQSVQLHAAGSNQTLIPVYQPDQFYVADFVNPAAGATRLGVAGSANSRYYITSVTMSFDPTSAGGNNYVTLSDSVYGTVWGTHISFPSAKPSAPVLNALNLTTPPGFFFLSTANGSYLSFNLFASINGGVTFDIGWGYA